jgi:hypothetical protein
VKVWQIASLLALWLVLIKAQTKITKAPIGIGLIFRLVLIAGFVFRFAPWKALLSMKNDPIFSVLLAYIKRRVE